MAHDAADPGTTDVARTTDVTGTAEVTRRVDVEAPPDEVWRVIADPDERRAWLDDPDADSRRVRIDESVPGERLRWTWWHPGDEDAASTVTVDLSSTTGDRTSVVVTETMPARTAVTSTVASASADATASAAGRWTVRLLGIELRFVGAPSPVG